MLCLSYLVGWNRGQAPRALTLNEEQKTSHQRKGKDTMSNYQMQMPAQYTSIGDDEMVLLCGGETTAWQTFQDIGRVLNYVADSCYYIDHWYMCDQKSKECSDLNPGWLKNADGSCDRIIICIYYVLYL